MPDAASTQPPFTGDCFIATGENGLRAFSRDGVTWTHQQTSREGILLDNACFANGRCVVIGKFGGAYIALTTTDGVKWDEAKLSEPYKGRFGILFAEGGEFHAVQDRDGSTPSTHSSTDGKVWGPGKPIVADRKGMHREAGLHRYASGNGRTIMVGDFGARLVRQKDAPLFVAVPGVPAKETLVDIAFGNGVFVGGGMHGLRIRSEDGVTWTDLVIGEEGEHINSMIWDGKQFVGIGQGATYLSPDGKAWRRAPNENAPTNAAFGAGIFIGILWPGKQLLSKDGIQWKQVHEFPHHVLAVAYGRLGAGAAG